MNDSKCSCPIVLRFDTVMDYRKLDPQNELSIQVINGKYDQLNVIKLHIC